jgi:LPS sulfotransferase NodH
MAPSPPYLIIANTPRSGSTLTSSVLIDTGATSGGHEYFEPAVSMRKFLLPQLGIENLLAVRADLDAYVGRIKQAFARPGTPFCVKIQWRDLIEWQQYGLDLDRHFPGARYVLCTRTNLVAQSVSLLRGLQTGAWSAKGQISGTPQYDFARLLEALGNLVKDEQSWDAYFRERGIEPYPLRYEDLDEDFRGRSLELLDWLGARLGPWRRWRLRPQMKKQRDALNREWEDRFYRDLLQEHARWEQLPLEERRRIWGREPG